MRIEDFGVSPLALGLAFALEDDAAIDRSVGYVRANYGGDRQSCED